MKESRTARPKMDMDEWRDWLVGRSVDPDRIDVGWEMARQSDSQYEATYKFESCVRGDVFFSCELAIGADNKIVGCKDWAYASCGPGHGRPQQVDLRRKEEAQIRKQVEQVLLADGESTDTSIAACWERRRIPVTPPSPPPPPFRPLGMDPDLFKYECLAYSINGQRERRRYCQTCVAGVQRSEGERREQFVSQSVHALLWLEFNIIRDEWCESIGCEPDLVFDRAIERETYVRCRRELTTLLGRAATTRYAEIKRQYNEQARQYLDGCQGKVHAGLGIARFTSDWVRSLQPCFVLPAFDRRGKHKPWGPHDVPWGSVEIAKYYSERAAAANTRMRHGRWNGEDL